jgi:hypothetical protein
VRWRLPSAHTLRMTTARNAWMAEYATLLDPLRWLSLTGGQLAGDLWCGRVSQTTSINFPRGKATTFCGSVPVGGSETRYQMPIFFYPIHMAWVLQTTQTKKGLGEFQDLARNHPDKKFVVHCSGETTNLYAHSRLSAEQFEELCS